MYVVTVQLAESSAQNRPGVSYEGPNWNVSRFIWRDRLVTGLYVGDLLKWSSVSGESYDSVVVGSSYELVVVLFLGELATITLDQITHLNGLPVREATAGLGKQLRRRESDGGHGA